MRPVPLADAHQLDTFDCGVASLNEWLTETSRRSEKSGDARTFVVTNTASQQVIGYYCLAPGSVSRMTAAGRLGRRAPDPVPVIVLGRLAVDLKHQKAGLGSVLVIDAMLRSLAAATTIGGRALVVNPIDQEAADFWHHIGFDKLREDPSTLYLMFRDVAAIDPWS